MSTNESQFDRLSIEDWSILKTSAKHSFATWSTSASAPSDSSTVYIQQIILFQLNTIIDREVKRKHVLAAAERVTGVEEVEEGPGDAGGERGIGFQIRHW